MIRRGREAVVLLVVAFFAGFVAAPFASSAPDGYERVAIDAGFAEAATASVTSGSPLADYAFGPVSVAVGLVAVLALSTLLRRVTVAPGEPRPV